MQIFSALGAEFWQQNSAVVALQITIFLLIILAGLYLLVKKHASLRAILRSPAVVRFIKVVRILMIIILATLLVISTLYIGDNLGLGIIAVPFMWLIQLMIICVAFIKWEKFLTKYPILTVCSFIVYCWFSITLAMSVIFPWD